MNELIAKVNLYQHSLDMLSVIQPAVPCEVNVLQEEDIKLLHEVWPVDLKQMKARLERGDKCFTCFVKDRIVHYSWVQFSGTHQFRDVGQQIEIAPRHGWIYHCRTSEWARGNGVYPYVLTQILDVCKSRVCQQVWIYTTPKNIASQKGIAKAGFSQYKQLISLKIFHRYFPLILLNDYLPR